MKPALVYHAKLTIANKTTGITILNVRKVRIFSFFTLAFITTPVANMPTAHTTSAMIAGMKFISVPP